MYKNNCVLLFSVTISTRIIVLNTTKVGDRSLVIHALSRDLGRRSFIVGVGSSRSGMALWQPLSILDCEVLENPKSDLWRLRGVSAAYPLSGLRGDLAKGAVSLFMAEVLYRTVREGAEPGLYDWCERSIITLDALSGSYANYHLRWLLEFSSALGFTPSMEDLAPCAGEHFRDIQGLMGPYESALLLPLSGSARSEIAEALLQYLSSHLEYPLNIRSLSVLGELFR